MFAGFFFLLLLSGGNTNSSVPSDGQNASNQSIFVGISGGNTTVEPESVVYRDDDQQATTQSSKNISDEEQKWIETERDRQEGKNCRLHDVINYLNLTENKDLYTMARPTKDHRQTTKVYLFMEVHAILDVRETDQTFISRVRIDTYWDNDFMRWDLNDFCGIDSVYIPTQSVWKPDIVIEEMLEQDKFYQSPFLGVYCWGLVKYTQEQVVRSTCKMAVYKFPFDIQRCNISFKSLLYSDENIKIEVYKNDTAITELSRKAISSQYEWIFINITVNNKPVSNEFNHSKIIYTITMKRRSVLYVVNFLLPIFFFFCLDLASFLMSDSGGEKLSYKVTVLLAVTVMQLILNDILPSSSDRVPLIATYCIGIFSLMMLSLMETILVMYLMEKDSASQDDETDQDGDLNENHEDKKGRANFHSCIRGMKRCTHCVSDVSTDETSSVVKEGSCSQLTEVSLVLGKVSDELGEIEKTMSQLSSRKTEKKRGYWTRMAKKINKIFAICYITAGTLFLIVMLSLWTRPEDNK